MIVCYIKSTTKERLIFLFYMSCFFVLVYGQREKSMSHYTSNDDLFSYHDKKRIRFIDLCAGIGGGRLGLEHAGFQCVGFSEILHSSIETYKQFFETTNECELGDLTKLDIGDIPDADVLIAGFPCQTFSIVGKRAGFQDERGQIIFHISKILKEKKIKYFILENVKGLVNHDHGKTIKTITRLLEDTGYVVYQKVLKSNDYGLPQKRERVYFVGIRKDLPNTEFVFPEAYKQQPRIEDFLIEEDVKYEVSDMTTMNKYLDNKYNHGKYVLSNILKEDFLVVDTRQSDLRFFRNYVPTLRTGRSGIMYVKNGKLRRLSGRESLLLQGFDRNIINKSKNNNDSVLLQQTGNAMSVNVIEAIANGLKETMKKNGDI